MYPLIAAGLIAAMAVALSVMGHPLICTCGYVKLWHGIPLSSENSQHIADWYTFSHVIHGFLFYGLFWLLGRRGAMPIGLRLAAAVALEGAWEIAENTDTVINRYREATIALDYYGDSIVNSVADMMFMTIGFIAAMRLPVIVTVALALVFEIAVGLHIRDNLLLNIIMLIYPNDTIRQWQSGPPII